MKNERLIIRLGLTLEDPVEYVVINTAGQVILGPLTSPLKELTTIATQRDSVILVSGFDVLLIGVKLVGVSRAQLAQAILYSLEDQLAQDIQDLHIALGKIQTDGTIPVAIVKRSVMQQWLTQLQSASIVPTIMLSEILAIPLQINTWNILVDNDKALLRTGIFEGAALEIENLTHFLRLAIAEAPVKPHLITVQNHTSNEHVDCFNLELPVEVKNSLDYLIINFIKDIEKSNAINLLQGEFRINYFIDHQFKKKLSLATVVGCLCLVTTLISHVMQYGYFSKQQTLLDQQIANQYQLLYPQSTQIISPRERIEQEIEQLRAIHKNNFLSLFTEVGYLIKRAVNVKLISLYFHNEVLIITVEAADFMSLQKLKYALQAKGLQVQQSNVIKANDFQTKFTIK